MSILNRLEIDVMTASEIEEAASLAHKYNLPGLVVHSGLSAEGHIARGRIGGKFKLITPVDWPKGENFGQPKLRGLTVDAFESDAFEILLTPNKNETETRNEAKSLHDFIRTHVGTAVEIRYVMGTLARSKDQIESQMRGLKGLPTPAFVRNDIALKPQVSKANPEIHNANIELFKEIVRTPTKIAGNINSLKAVAACKNADLFGVNLTQAKQIIQQFNNHPVALKDMLVED